MTSTYDDFRAIRSLHLEPETGTGKYALRRTAFATTTSTIMGEIQFSSTTELLSDSFVLVVMEKKSILHVKLTIWRPSAAKFAESVLLKVAGALEKGVRGSLLPATNIGYSTICGMNLVICILSSSP